VKVSSQDTPATSAEAAAVKKTAELSMVKRGIPHKQQSILTCAARGHLMRVRNQHPRRGRLRVPS
jgi:hypothetical protein